MNKGITFYVFCLFLVINFQFSFSQTTPAFSQSELNLNGNNFSFGSTSMIFGPDGRLYVSEYPTGVIKILSVERNSATDYIVTSVESLQGIRAIIDHNDDGSFHSSSNRQVTGLTVSGTAANPIIYVASSDVRIGAGSGGGNGDIGLDTNSGVITRMSFNGTDWDVVDLVRGLPRSEENHSTNGLEFTTINGTNYLLVASGGFTNAGAPSTNFVYTCEYALSGAVLSVDLDAINALPILDDNGRNYIYDIPTLDDPSRANANGITDPDISGYNGIDINDPFGGNDGLNQAMVVTGGPVQIFSPGYRNAYDLVVTENNALFITDNGANRGWGGLPENEGGGNATNNYDPTEPGSQVAVGNELIDNQDHLQLITTDLANYIPNSLYGGHPNPTRANPSGAGLYVAPNQNGNSGAVFRTLTYDPNGSTPGSTTDASIALPANWPPVPAANPVEGDWRGPTVTNPDGAQDNPVTIWGTNTNGIDEYTATNFGGAMQGNLLAGHSSGFVRRVELNTDGSLSSLNQTFASGTGGNNLGITCNSDNDIFPGTFWVGTLNGKILVFEPQDFFNCIDITEPGYDANADYDEDGYTNQDEVDNTTDSCNGGSQPTDFDAVSGSPLISDLNDNDDDADGIADALDSFQLGDPSTLGSDAFDLPIVNDLFNDQQGLGGIFGLGMTGLMNNGDTDANWINWLDDRDNGPNPNDVLGGAPGLMTSHMTSGTALGTTNTQEKGYQFGVQTSTATGQFTVAGNLINMTGPLRLYGNTTAIGGELGHFIGDGTQSNYIKMVLTTDGITALQEINDVPQTPINIPLAIGDRPASGIVFSFVIDPTNGNVELQYSIDGATAITAGTIFAQGSILNAIQQANQDLAVGFIGTSNTIGVELEGTWDFLSVIPTENELEFPLNINVGGTAVDLNGETFKADQFFTGGNPFINENALVADLYKTERSSPNKTFSYDIPLENQEYFIDLHFADIYWGATGGGAGGVGSRVFDVFIEGELVLDNFDIIAEVGVETPAIRTFPVDLTDGILNIEFSALAVDGGVDQPKVSAISIREDLVVFNPLQIGAIANQLNSVNDAVDFGITATGGNPNVNFAYSISGQPAGVSIEPTNGLIFGSINPEASSGGVNEDGIHNVTITVSKEGSDPVFKDFTWAINQTFWTDKNENENYTARHENSFVQAGDKFYLMGGRENATTLDVYDYTTNTWTNLTNSAPFEFNHYQATEYQGLIWVIGAFKDNNFPNEIPADYIWIFNPATAEWIQGPEIPAARRRGSSGLVVYNDKFYVVAGNTDGHDGGFVPWFDEYDPATGVWTSLTDAPRSRDHFHATLIGTKLYASGGRLSGGTGGVFKPVIAEVDVYDFTTGNWSTLPVSQNLPTPRGGPSAVNFNDKLVVFGGEVENELVDGVNFTGALDITEEYDPVTSKWTRIADLNHARHGTQGIVSGTGVFVLGGSQNLGGGNQKNMEFLGEDAPQGAAAVASVLTGPESRSFESNTSETITIEANTGTNGILVSSIEISGPDAANFSITSGELVNTLINSNTSHDVIVNYTGITDANASLILNYENDSQVVVSLLGEGIIAPTSFTLVNADTNNDLFEITNGQQISESLINGMLLNIRADSDFDTIGSVQFQLTGALTNTRVENVAVYALYGDVSNNYYGVDFPIGDYALTGTVYSESQMSGTVLDSQSITFSIVDDGVVNLAPIVSNPGVQNSTVSDNIALQIIATDDGSNLVYEASGLPSGLSIDANTGLISGTILTATDSPFNVTIDVTDDGEEVQTSSVSFTWNVALENRAPIVTNPGVQNSIVGDNISLQIVATDDGDNLTYVATGLPLGLNIDENSGLISGTIVSPEENETTNYNVGVEVTDEGSPELSSTIDFVWTVEMIPSEYTLIVNDGSGDGDYEANTIIAIIADTAPENMEFDQWVGDVSGVVDINNASTTIAMPATNVIVSATYAAIVVEPLTTFTLVNADANIDLFSISDGQTINADTIDGMLLNIRADNDTPTIGSVHFELSGALTNSRTENVAVYALYGDFANQYYGTVFPEGDYTLTATVYSGSQRSGSIIDNRTISFSIGAEVVENTAPIVTNPGVQNSTVSDNIALQIIATDDGTSLVYEAIELPSGLSINTTTGLISGTILDATDSPFNVVINVTDDDAVALTSSVSFIWNVNIQNTAPIVTNPGVQNSTVGDDITLQIVAADNGTNLVYEATELPSGLSIDANTGLISGTILNPEENETTDYSVGVEVTDDGSPELSSSVNFVWTIEIIPSEYTLTVNNGLGDGLYEAGTVVSIEADTAPNGQEFDVWSGDVASVADINIESTTFTMSTASATVNATYKDIVVEPTTIFTLVDATTNSDLITLEDGQEINESSIQGMSLNIRADNNAPVIGSVHFELSGALTNTRTENVAVYALYGDVANNYYGVSFPTGAFTLTATVYSGFQQSGTIIDTRTISFSIVADIVENTAPTAENPGDQNNDEGDVVSLQIDASDIESGVTYEATNLPPGLSIDPNTGLISGTILSEDTEGGAFQESNGLVVVEAESGDIVPGWSESSIGGETGILASTNSFNSASTGFIPYEIAIETPGVYRFVWNNLFSGSNPTDENDSWLKFDNNDDVWFFAHQGSVANEATLINKVQGSQSNILFPKGSSRVTAATTPEGAGSNGFFKAYRSGGSSETYSWQALTNDGLGYEIYVWFVNPGTYTMQLAERSAGHAIDKIALYKVDGTQYTNAQLSATTESNRAGNGNGAAASSPYNVTVTVTDAGNPALSTSIEFEWNIIAGGNLAGRSASVGSGVYIFPNPATEHIGIKISNAVSKVDNVVLYDMTGKEVSSYKSAEIFIEETVFRMPIDDGIKNGIYLLQVNFENSESTFLRVVVEKP